MRSLKTDRLVLVKLRPLSQRALRMLARKHAWRVDELAAALDTNVQHCARALDQLVDEKLAQWTSRTSGCTSWYSARILKAGIALLPKGVCRVCGCTEERPCDPPCWWTDPDMKLCTRCKEK